MPTTKVQDTVDNLVHLKFQDSNLAELCPSWSKALKTGFLLMILIFSSLINAYGSEIQIGLGIYTAQQKFSMDFIFVLILVRIRNDLFEVINKYGNP